MEHNDANSEFRYLYSEIGHRFTELDSFLKHIHSFISEADEKIGPNLKLYSPDFFDFFYAATYGETFRSSFIVSVTSVSETYIKSYITTWSNVLGLDISHIKHNNGILDYLKATVKKTFKIEIDCSKNEVNDFRNLLEVRNTMVHSGAYLNNTSKLDKIKQLSKAYPSMQLRQDGAILTTEKFCIDSMEISKRFFFYLFKLAIKKYPNYLS